MYDDVLRYNTVNAIRMKANNGAASDSNKRENHENTCFTSGTVGNVVN